MSTTMLDALLDEARNVREMAIQSSKLTIELASAANHLTTQIRHLAQQGAEITEFKNPPGTHPAAQIDEQGKHGSDEVAPGGQSACAESESVGTVAASEELVQASVDPEVAPDPAPPITNKDRFLDAYAASTTSQAAICRQLDLATSSVSPWLSQARRACDPRAAKGDLNRCPVPAPQPAPEAPPEPAQEARAPAEPIGPYVPTAPTPRPREPLEYILPDPAPGGDLLRLDKNTCEVTYRQQTLIVARHELRMLLRVNDQMPTEVEEMYAGAGVLTVKSLDHYVSRLNDRIRNIGVEIVKDPAGPLYTLRRVQAAG